MGMTRTTTNTAQTVIRQDQLQILALSCAVDHGAAVRRARVRQGGRAKSQGSATAMLACDAPKVRESRGENT